MDPVLVARRLRRHRSHKGPNWFFRIVGGLAVSTVILISIVVLSGVGALAGVYAYYAKDLPDPEKIETEQEKFETTKLYDRTGQHLLYEIFDPRRGDRTIVPLDEIPLYLRQATIAIEDRSFYDNMGIDLRGMGRAVWSNLQGGQIQGGSSITQQLVKHVLIPAEERYQQLYSRKIKETIMALEISRRYSGKEGKDKILEWYLNYISYGNLAYGAEAAAQVYFAKHVQELTLPECAMLAAQPQFPGMNPIDAPEEAKKRQGVVLDQMVAAKYITAEQAEQAKAEPLRVTNLTERFDIVAPHFSMYVRKLLESEFGPDLVYQGGLKVYTTLDLDLQTKAEESVKTNIKLLQEDKKIEHNVSNGALVAIRPNTGEVLAMVGSADYWNKEIDGNVNVALAERQPGSAFKLFTYLTAFAQGHSAAEMIMDVRTCPNPDDPSWCPENYDRKYHGPQRVRNAFARSYNIPAVKVLDMAGVGNVIKTSHRMGIDTLNRDLDYYGLSLTLGGGEVRLLDLTYAYGVVANSGVMAGKAQPVAEQRPGYRELDPVSILRVVDSAGNILYDYRFPDNRQVVSPQICYMINSILADNSARAAAFGSNSKLKLTRPAAAKTGTTNDYKDAWTIGFTPQLVTGVWVGNSNNESMDRVAGSLGAAPIWHDFMEAALEGTPEVNLQRPPGLQDVEVCSISGMLPTEDCPSRVREAFIEGTAPTTFCTIHQKFRVNRDSGKLATIYTPPELVEERVYEIYPPEAADWITENKIPQPPTEYDDVSGVGPAVGDVGITSPHPYAYLKGMVIITGTVKPPDLQLWRLEYGEGLNPSAWIQIGADHNNAIDNSYLETWDVTALQGLYTLQLTAVDSSQQVKQATIQVTIDNVPPLVKVGHPTEADEYLQEADEYVNIQADVTENVSMKRVDFFVDSKKVASTTISPFNQKWTIKMQDLKPKFGKAIEFTETFTDDLGVLVSRVVTMSEEIVDPTGITLTQVFSNGLAVISGTTGISESHTIHVVAVDAAGNETESERVHILVSHKPKDDKKKDKENAAGTPEPVATPERTTWVVPHLTSDESQAAVTEERVRGSPPAG